MCIQYLLIFFFRSDIDGQCNGFSRDKQYKVLANGSERHTSYRFTALIDNRLFTVSEIRMKCLYK